MADPTTLAALAAQEVTRATAAVSAAQSALRAAQSEQAAATAEGTDLATQLSDLGKEEKQALDDYAAATTDADREAVTQTLATLSQNRRSLEHLLVDNALRVEVARRTLAAQQAEVTRATAGLSAANADQTAQSGQNLGGPPPPSLAANATAALAGTDYAAAKARVELDVPAKLLARARAREADQQAHIERLRDMATAAKKALDGAQAASGGKAGAAGAKQSAYDAAVAALRDSQKAGQSQLGQATALIAGITTAKPLSADAVTARDAAAVSDAILGHEKARDDARTAVEEKQVDLDAALASAAIADPDDIEGAQAVQDARAALATAEGDLATAETAYTASDRRKVDAWEATIPDSSWRLLANFETATSLLNDLKSPQFTTLMGAVTTAEGDLVAARVDDLKAGRSIAWLQAQVRTRTDLAEAASQGEAAQVFGALRGDG